MTHIPDPPGIVYIILTELVITIILSGFNFSCHFDLLFFYYFGMARIS